MPLPIATDDIIAVKVACLAADQLGLNDFAYKATITTGTCTYEDLLNKLDDLLEPLYVVLLPSTAQYYGVSVQRILPLPKTQPFTKADPSPGSALGDLIPRQAAAIIAKKGTLAGRPGRGRIYVPFLADGIVGDTGHINTLGLTNLNALAAVICGEQTIDFGGGNAMTLTPVLLNKLTPFFNVITAFASRTKVGTQKRRGDYGKGNGAPW